MGHSIQYYKFDISKPEKEIEYIANEDAIYDSDTRSSLPGNIRFIKDKIYEDEEKAYEAIEKLDKGWYDQLAVKFYKYQDVPDTKAMINLSERISKANQAFSDYKVKNSIKNRKSQYIGCTKCGSKVNKDYIPDKGYNWNKCPLCNTDLCSDTVKNAIASKLESVEKMNEEYKKLKRQNAKKGKKTIKWLVKTEYHV